MHNKLHFCVALLLIFISVGLPGASCFGVESIIAWPEIDSDSAAIIQATGRLLGVEATFVETAKELENRIGRRPSPSLTMITDSFISGLQPTKQKQLSDMLTRAESSLLLVLDRSSCEGSQDVIVNFTKYRSSVTKGVLTFSSQHNDILGELAGLRLSVRVEKESVFFSVDAKKEAYVEPLIWLEGLGGEKHTIMAMRKIGKRRLYVATFPHCRMIGGNETFEDLPRFFPMLIFLKSECGGFCWHRKTILANLTIDDPWLVEPYGNLSYKVLLQQMEMINFHTTIAFVPWNYDRSHGDVVELFLKNPDRYSIAFHGNNHDRQEFGNYEDHPFKTQEASVSQAAARMREFTKITAIPVSRVMIFPHGIAPEKTLGTLREHDFVATINSRILPLGDKGPVDVDAMLWPATLKYYGLPVLQRFNPRVDRNIINILLYLGKPLLFYTHQDYFFGDIGAFNDVAKYVNLRTSQRAQWVDLKQVCEGLYMERQRADGEYDIRMLARSVTIRNMSKRRAVYHIREIWTGKNTIEKLIKNGVIYSGGFEEELDKPAVLGPGETTTIELLYKEPGDQLQITTERSGFRVFCIRWLSDLRDRYFSTNWLGRKLIQFMSRIIHGSQDNR